TEQRQGDDGAVQRAGGVSGGRTPPPNPSPARGGGARSATKRRAALLLSECVPRIFTGPSFRTAETLLFVESGSGELPEAVGEHRRHPLASLCVERAGQGGAEEIGGASEVTRLDVARRRADAVNGSIEFVPEAVEERSQTFFVPGRCCPERPGRFG